MLRPGAWCEGCGQTAIAETRAGRPICADCIDEGYGDEEVPPMTTTKEQTMDEDPTNPEWHYIDLFRVIRGSDKRTHAALAKVAANYTAAEVELARTRARATIAQRDAMIRQLGENAAKAAYKYADNMAELRATIAQQGEELARMREALVNHNDVLRSAYQIAARKGAQTEWEGFTLRAGSVLHFHHEEVEAARAAVESPKQ